jgi:hypothetical protein
MKRMLIKKRKLDLVVDKLIAALKTERGVK